MSLTADTMKTKLRRYAFPQGPQWSIDGEALSPAVTLKSLLTMRRSEMRDLLSNSIRGELAPGGLLLTPVEPDHEVWACGVTYLRSRVEREAESSVADVYAKVYEAERPEIFFKSAGWRVVGKGQKVRIRRDSPWNVPEPELTLIVNCHGEIVGYTAGNDMSSRSIEGENPLYLPQAKTYDGACAVGPCIVLADESELSDLGIHLLIIRDNVEVFVGDARTSQMKRSFSELVGYLFRETSFPHGVFVMTGTGIVPPQGFTLLPKDTVFVTVGGEVLVNEVAG